MKRILSLGLAGFLFVVSPVQAEEELRQVPVTSSFTHGEINWRSEKLGYEYVWKVRVHNGFFEICGAGTYHNNAVRSGSRKIMRRAHIEYNGEVIMKDMTFFTIVSKTEPLNKAMATCRTSTTKAPKGRFSVRLYKPGGKVRL